jgi:hypothetical protein
MSRTKTSRISRCHSSRIAAALIVGCNKNATETVGGLTPEIVPLARTVEEL